MAFPEIKVEALFSNSAAELAKKVEDLLAKHHITDPADYALNYAVNYVGGRDTYSHYMIVSYMVGTRPH